MIARSTHREITRNRFSFLCQSSTSPVIFGYPWLATHNPQIDWASGTLTAWGVACHSQCLRSARSPAFVQLKVLFTSAPVLCHPDTARQFTVEVDASEVGVGAVLSQRAVADEKQHLCLF